MPFFTSSIHLVLGAHCEVCSAYRRGSGWRPGSADYSNPWCLYAESQQKYNNTVPCIRWQHVDPRVRRRPSKNWCGRELPPASAFRNAGFTDMLTATLTLSFIHQTKRGIEACYRVALRFNSAAVSSALYDSKWLRNIVVQCLFPLPDTSLMAPGFAVSSGFVISRESPSTAHTSDHTETQLHTLSPRPRIRVLHAAAARSSPRQGGISKERLRGCRRGSWRGVAWRGKS
jgi:hypothetical protein